MQKHACGTYPACACVRACVRACLCAHGPKPERVSILAQPWHAMRATADRACSGAARYPQPLYISGVNRFITVRRPASKANEGGGRRPAHKRSTCRVPASEARLQWHRAAQGVSVAWTQVFFYLMSTEKGGETSFPKANNDPNFRCTSLLGSERSIVLSEPLFAAEYAIGSHDVAMQGRHARVRLWLWIGYQGPAQARRRCHLV